MFRKPQDLLLSTKTNIRKKEVKDLKQRIKYSLDNYTDEADKELFGNGTSVEMLKLKSGILLYKLKDGPVLFIETQDKRFYPTVNALWRCPSIVPTVYTNSFVSQKIMEGAGLMVPGIVVPKDGVPQLLLKKVVAVGTYNNPKPFAIGYCCVNDFQAQVASGKGKAIEIVHVYRDTLFNEYGDEKDLPAGYTAKAVYPILETSVECGDNASSQSEEDEEDEEGEERKDVEEKKKEESHRPIISNSDNLDDLADLMKALDDDDDDDANNDAIGNDGEKDNEPASCTISEKQMDDEFLHLSIRCLHEVGPEELPMQTSTFNSKYFNQKEFINHHYASEYFCGDVAGPKGLRWSETSFKKFSVLMDYLEEKKVLTLKKINKQPNIMTINCQHPWIRKYHDYIAHFKAEAVKPHSSSSSSSTTSEQTSRTTVTSLYRINKAMKNIFLAMQMNPDELYSMSDAKSVLNGYLQVKGLVQEGNSGIVNLNEELIDALYRDKKVPQGGFPSAITRKELAQLFDEKLISYSAVQVNDRVVIKKGARKNIEITTEKVKGAKSPQTMVYNVSDFSIDIKELLKSLMKACASSGCIHSNQKGEYIQIQGKLGSIVKDCLVKEYKIPSKFINVK